MVSTLILEKKQQINVATCTYFVNKKGSPKVDLSTTCKFQFDLFLELHARKCHLILLFRDLVTLGSVIQHIKRNSSTKQGNVLIQASPVMYVAN